MRRCFSRSYRAGPWVEEASLEITITFSGGRKVRAEFNGLSVETDRPVAQGGAGSAPTPYELFLASLGACTGSVVLGFCLERDIPHEGISLRQRAVHARGPRGRKTLEKVVTEIALPPGFPGKYHAALLRATEQCSVKRAVQASPAFEVRAVVRPG